MGKMTFRASCLIVFLICSAFPAFAVEPTPKVDLVDIFIGRPTASTPLNSTDTIPIIQGGALKKIRPANLGIGSTVTGETVTTFTGALAGYGGKIQQATSADLPSHKSRHATGGTDELTAADVGAATAAQGGKADTALQPAAAAAAYLPKSNPVVTDAITSPDFISSAPDGAHYVLPYNSVAFSGTPAEGMIQTTPTGLEVYLDGAWGAVSGTPYDDTALWDEFQLYLLTTDFQALELEQAARFTNLSTSYYDYKAATTVSFSNMSSMLNNLKVAMNNYGVDTTPPVLTRVSPVDLAATSFENALIFEYVVADPQGLHELTPLTYAFNGGPATALVSGLPSAPESAPEANTAYPWTVTALNAAGMTTTESGTFAYITPVASVDPATLAFGNVSTGSTRILTASLSNAGMADLVVGTAEITGTDASYFSLSADACSAATVAPAGECLTSVMFTPGVVVGGPYSAQLEFPHNAGAPTMVALSGTAILGAVLYSDDFTRADANPIGGNWATLGTYAGLQLLNNSVVSATVAADGVAYYNQPVSDDQFSEFTFGTATGGYTYTGPMIRSGSNAKAHYKMYYNASTVFVQYITSTGSIGATLYSAAHAAPSTGTKYRLEATGSTISAYINDVLFSSSTSTALTTGYPGIHLYSTTNPGTYWRGGNL